MGRRLLTMTVGGILVAALATAGVQAQESEDARLKEARQALKEAQKQVQEAARRLAELEGPKEIAKHMVWVTDKARIGVVVRSSSDDPDGAKVVAVTPGGPADEAGVKAGDVIVMVDGAKLTPSGNRDAARQLHKSLEDLEPGQEVTLEVQRDGSTQTVKVKAARIENILGGHDVNAMTYSLGSGDLENIDVDVEPFTGAFLGKDGPLSLRLLGTWHQMELVRLNPGLGKYFGTDEGLLVVQPPGDAAMGLEAGDVILKIGSRTPSSPAQAVRILRSYEAGESIHLEILRDHNRRSVDVKVPEEKSGAETFFLEPPRPERGRTPRGDGSSL